MKYAMNDVTDLVQTFYCKQFQRDTFQLLMENYHTFEQQQQQKNKIPGLLSVSVGRWLLITNKVRNATIMLTRCLINSLVKVMHTVCRNQPVRMTTKVFLISAGQFRTRSKVLTIVEAEN